MENCKRFRFKYRGANLYIVAGKQGITLAIENRDNFRTLAGLQLIENLINELIGADVPMDVIIWCCRTATIQKNDIPDLIAQALETVNEIDIK